MAYYKVRDVNTGLYMDKRYLGFQPKGALFGNIEALRNRVNYFNQRSEIRLQNTPDWIAPNLEIVEFILVESNIIE